MNNEEIEKEYKKLEGIPRLLIEAELEPAQGERFQPTGFPELGAAVYERPDGKRMILVESAQSMANRLEAVCLKTSGSRFEIKDELNGLSYIIAELEEDINKQKTSTQTSTLVEAHRINSPYIISDQKFKSDFKNKADYAKGKSIVWENVAKALFYYDVNSLLHGVFLANLEDGRVKVPRALTGFIEAEDIREVLSGGVKNNLIDPTGNLRAENLNSNVYGNVPFHRIEYTANKIKAYFNIDLALIDGYNLDPSAKRLLISLALYKISIFLKTGLRLRTACDLKQKGDLIVTQPSGFNIPSEEDLISILKHAIEECKVKGLFADPPVTKVRIKIKENKEEKNKDEATEEDESS